MDLISRQAALDALDERCESECEYSQKQRSVMCAACHFGSAKEVVENAPTIDPVIHGKWICVDGKYYCSECDEEQDWKTRYCSGCGARMAYDETD